MSEPATLPRRGVRLLGNVVLGLLIGTLLGSLGAGIVTGVVVMLAPRIEGGLHATFWIAWLAWMTLPVLGAIVFGIRRAFSSGSGISEIRE